MKIIIVVVLCALAAAVKASLSKEELVESIRTVSAGCLEETGATEADLDIMVKHLPAQNRETKCLRACVMKKLNVMNDDGKFVKETAIKMADLHTQGDPEKMKLVEEVISSCQAVTVSDDHCEAAETYKMCLTDAAKKHGFDLTC